LEIDKPVSDFYGESAESKTDYTGNQSDSESDNGTGEENSDEASNPTVFFKNRVTNVAGTLRLNSKNVLPTVKNANSKKGQVISQQSNGVMVIKWEAK
jgi:hypothetical protein